MAEHLTFLVEQCNDINLFGVFFFFRLFLLRDYVLNYYFRGTCAILLFPMLLVYKASAPVQVHFRFAPCFSAGVSNEHGKITLQAAYLIARLH